MTERTDDQRSDARRLERALERMNAAIDWERRKRDGAAAMRLSIDPARDLLARLGDPHRRMRCVHVTGTKGKGSTAALIAAGLATIARTALYTSPHVERVQERLRLDGREVDDELLASAIELAFDAREAAAAEKTSADAATWFDLMTAACFWASERAGAAWLVAEVGLGGRLDSTNAIVGEVCVITTIELEHANVLGSSREAIAAEKAGILKRGSTLVTGVAASDPASAPIEARARELGVPIERVDLTGLAIEARNVALARAALDQLRARGVAVGGEVLRAELVAAARLPGRLERFELDGVEVVVDGAHVAESVRDVAAELRAARAGAHAIAVVAAGRDKDLDRMLKALAPHVDRLIATTVDQELQFTPDEISARARRQGLPAEPCADPRAALRRAVELARSAGANLWVLVIGSLYLAGSVRPVLVHARRRRSC